MTASLRSGQAAGKGTLGESAGAGSAQLGAKAQQADGEHDQPQQGHDQQMVPEEAQPGAAQEDAQGDLHIIM